MADFSGGPGFLAFVATFSVVIVLVLLAMSLNRHLRKIRTQPPKTDGPEAGTAPSADASTQSPA